MRTLLFISLFLSFLFSFSQSNHILGNEIVYSTSGSNDSIFEVQYVFYRNCNGCSILNQSPSCSNGKKCDSLSQVPTFLNIRCVSTNSIIGKVQLSRTSISDVSMVCKSDTSKCAAPCNGKQPVGIEKHVFAGSVDLRSFMKTGCCEFRFESLLQGRGNSFNTFSGDSMFTFLYLNACLSQGNASPVFTNEPLMNVCCNQPFFYNPGVVDPVGKDSLSFTLSDALKDYNQSVNYSTGYSGAAPVKSYYPNGYNPLNGPKPNANPPIGIFLDNRNGNTIFTPVDCNQNSLLVYEVTEWRKDKMGVYTILSVVRREQQIKPYTCSLNNTPKITNTKYEYTVCEGDKLCFDINTQDVVFVPPPPAKTPQPDTVSLEWNNAIKNATFNIKNPMATNKSGTFCWQTKPGDASVMPYTFNVVAKDNSCPLNAGTSITFSVTVTKKIKANISSKNLGCRTYALEPDFSVSPPANVQYTWEVLDSSGKSSDPSNFKFKSGKATTSTQSKDTITFNSGGRFYIRLSLNHPDFCNSSSMDTFVLLPPLSIKLQLGQNYKACLGDSVILDLNGLNGTPPFKYKWYAGSSILKDTGMVLRTTIKSNTKYFAEVTDGLSCTTLDSITVITSTPPLLNTGPDTSYCIGDTISLQPGPMPIYKNYKWNTGDTTFSILVTKTGTYIVQAENTDGCKGVDTINLTFKNCNLGFANKQLIKDLKVYPNPAKSSLFVEFTARGKGASIELRDPLGKVVIKNDTESGPVKKQFAVDELTPGLYILSVKDEYRINYIRVMLE